MGRRLLAQGARGDLVRQIQIGLAMPNPDETYGPCTERAVAAFQAAGRLPETGVVDADTWTRLTSLPDPALRERALQLTAAFEGHNYTLAVGDFDGAWLTWGIIGFTLANGEVQSILRAVDCSAPHLLDAAFCSNAGALRAMLNAPAAKQRSWAQANTTKGGGLAEPWKSAFATFGGYPEVRAEQRRRAFDVYYAGAEKTAARFGLTSELGLALSFDIHVQNGGVAESAARAAAAMLALLARPTELQRRETIANAVADHARPQYREDVRLRKLAIARGRGAVHGRNYVLENWGLAELPASG